MQKKSLLVALFCGALCLTGCIKNEESASVAQVRIAKANELNSIADLNKAKAAAEGVYAQAELVVAQAEAALRMAQANLVNAQAETEKVRAELLKVQVALAEVVVDEEKVKLQLLEADLEKHLAEVEAAVAKAEKEKQEWIDKLEHEVALAEEQSLKDALAILKAQDELQKYILTQEGAKADSAKAAGARYFAALRNIQDLQLESIKTKATKALVEAGALQIRDAIHYEMEKIDEEIAKKETLLAYLKEYQTMTPEEAETALLEARKELTDAYNAYKAAVEAEDLAKGEYALVAPLNSVEAGKGLTSAFTDGKWYNNFIKFVNNNWGQTYTWWGRHGRQSRYVSYVKPEQVIEYEDYAAVTYWGYTDPKDPTNFIKLWKAEQPMTRTVLYPTIEEQSVRHFKNEVEEMVIAPAEIYYDNIVTVLDSIEARQQAQVAKDVQAAKDASAENVEAWQKAIAANKDTLALHQEYVNARKDTIAKLESELETLVKAYNTSAEGHTTAVEAYQKYMMLNYEVPKVYFENEIDAAKDTVKASSEYSTALKNWGDKKTLLEGQLTTDKKNAHDADSVARVTYNEVVTTAETTWNGFNDRFVNAVRAWSPVFEGSYTKTNTKKINGDAKPWYYKYNKGHFTIDHVNGQLDTTGSTQKDWLITLGDQIEAKKAWDDSVATQASEEHIAQAKQIYISATAAVSSQKTVMDFAEIDYNGEQLKYEQVWGTVDEARKAYNPDFENKKYSDADVKYDATKGEWYKMDGTKKNVAGTAQGAKFMADSLYDAANYQVTGHGTEAAPTLLDIKEAKKLAYDGKKEAWQTRYDDLLHALETTKKDYKADPKVAELYEATLVAAETVDKFTAKFNRLQMRYGLTYNVFDPEKGGAVFVNYLAPEDPYDGKDGAWHNDLNKDYGFGWIISNYHLNPEYEFINSVDIEDGKAVIKKMTVAEKLYGKKTFWNDNTAKSLSAINARYTKLIADEPASLQETIDGIENSQAVKDLKQGIADVKAALKKYQGFEAQYKTWVANREKAFEAWNEAKKDTYDAEKEWKDVEAEYEALEGVANGMMWIYVGPTEENPDGFVQVNVNQAIKRLEGDMEQINMFVAQNVVPFVMRAIINSDEDEEGEEPGIGFDEDDREAFGQGNSVLLVREHATGFGFDRMSIAGLNFTKKLLQKALSVGKVTLQMVLDAYDEELAIIEEEIDLQTKLAAIYKAIMNGWLGIVDEAVVEEPVEEEGDEE